MPFFGSSESLVQAVMTQRAAIFASKWRNYSTINADFRFLSGELGDRQDRLKGWRGSGRVNLNLRDLARWAT